MEVQQLKTISEIGAETFRTLSRDDFPFSRFEFLCGLEQSRCVGPHTGWTPHHLMVQGGGAVQALLLGFSKDNSYGEFVFDFHWAEVFQQLGRAYYPKFTSMIPFTPASGSKLLVHPDADREEVGKALWQHLRKADSPFSSYHFLYTSEDEACLWRNLGCHEKWFYQFHWKNQGYQTFDDFLAQLTAKRRKEVRRERNKAHVGLDYEWITGAALNDRWADFAYLCYRSTVDDKTGQAYLNQQFFRSMFEALPGSILFLVAREGEVPVASALFLYEGKNMFGRYWGSVKQLPYVHFELCYYAAIEWAIAHGIELIEAGAQGEHKIYRGFIPAAVRSFHAFSDKMLHDNVGRWIKQDNLSLREGVVAFKEHSPYAAQFQYGFEELLEQP